MKIMMSLHLAVLQHERETGLGAFAGLLGEAGADYELLETNGATRLPDAAAFDGVIVLGGSLAVSDPALLETRRWIRNAVLGDMPVLGICLGGQLLAAALGGSVGRASHPEVGVHDVFRAYGARRDPLFSGLPGRFPVFGWHEDEFELPRGAIPLAESIACEYQAFRFGTSAYGLQFHPEVRADDLPRWAAVQGYADVLERSAGRWDDVAAELERARPELDELAQRLLERWLNLVSDHAAFRERRTRVAV